MFFKDLRQFIDLVAKVNLLRHIFGAPRRSGDRGHHSEAVAHRCGSRLDAVILLAMPRPAQRSKVPLTRRWLSDKSNLI
jgi:hypothetical protein